jgi:hypothetical protein
MMPRRLGLIVGVGCVLLAAGMAVPARAKVDLATRLLEKNLSLHGSTGWVKVPNAGVAGSGEVCFGLRRAEASVNLSVFGLLEGGIHFEADRLGSRFEQYKNLSSWDRVRSNVPAFAAETFQGQAKLKLLDQDWAEVGLALGVEEQDPYVVAQRFFPNLSKVTVLAGWGRGRFAQGFGGLSKTITPGAEFMFEFDGRGVNAGLKMLLAHNLVLAIAIQDFNTIGEVRSLGEVIGTHFLFGITYVERAW